MTDSVCFCSWGCFSRGTWVCDCSFARLGSNRCRKGCRCCFSWLVSHHFIFFCCFGRFVAIFAFGCLANHGTRIAHLLPYQNHSSSCDLIIHCSKSCTNLLEPLPNQQHTIKDKEESQDLECLNPAMIDMIHTMKKTNYSRSKQSRVFLYT